MSVAALLPLVRCSRPDLVIVSSEGRESYSWRLLLALHSPLAAGLLLGSNPTDGSVSSLALPSVSHAAVQDMLAGLASLDGVARLRGNEAAALLGLEGAGGRDEGRGKQFIGSESRSWEFPLTIDAPPDPPMKEELMVQSDEEQEDVNTDFDAFDKDHVDEEKDETIRQEDTSLAARTHDSTLSDIGDHEVKIVEKTLCSGKSTITCYVDRKYLFYCKNITSYGLYFCCSERSSPGGTCSAKLVLRKSFSEREGRSTYEATKLSSGPHTHAEQPEKVMVDFGKYQLRQRVEEEVARGWRKGRTQKQIYTDFVEEFTVDMDEERKSLFFVTFPAFKTQEGSMQKWKKRCLQPFVKRGNRKEEL